MIMLAPQDSSAAPRGLSAWWRILVVIGHARLMLLDDARNVAHLGIIQRAFYFSTSLGPIAVMIFFVLSGYLVGGSVLRSFEAGRWSWSDYLIARASRLYTVLIPAIAIGALIDLAGLQFLGWRSPYSVQRYGFMLPESISVQIGLNILVGNLLFLQEFFVPTIGTNHPLWSLTNEGWYYLMFPLLMVLAAPSRLQDSVVNSVILAAILVFLPVQISLLLTVWLFGVVVAVIPVRRMSFFIPALVTLVLLATLAARVSGVGSISINDYMVGILLSVFIFAWMCYLKDRKRNIIGSGAAFLSNISYSLYLFHMPFIVFVAALIVQDGTRYQPTLYGCGLVVTLLLGAIGYAALMWTLFERNTGAVRKFLKNIPRRSPQSERV